MNDKIKNALVPKLRFPEFREAGEWEEKVLGDEEISLFVKEKAPLGKLKLESYVSTENLLPDYTGVAIASKLPPSGSFTQYKMGDILLSNIRPYLKKIWSADKEGGASNDVIVIRAGNALNEVFLSFLLKNDSFINYVMEGAKGLKMPRGDKSLIEEYRIKFPPKKEQQKIAATLTALDDLISAQQEKINALQRHKKGLMQQLFPAEGERVPRVRFGEFEGEWEEKKIEDLATRGSGHTPNKSQPSYYNGGIKWVSLADSNRLDNGYIYETKTKISIEGLKNSSAVLHSAGTVIISRDAGVGKSAVLHSEMAVSQHFIAWCCDDSKLSNWFLYYFLQVMKPIFESIASGSTIKTIGLPYFKEIRISTPSLPEQQKIAAVLTSLDDLLAAEGQRLAALRLWKQGLMQGMFPNAND